MKHPFIFVPAFILLLLLGACSHYQMGRAHGYDKNHPVAVWVAPVLMEEPIPDVAIPLNRELRETVIRNTAWTLEEQENLAQYSLRVVVVERNRETLARRTNDTGLSDVLKLQLIAAFELLDANGTLKSSGEVEIDGQIFRAEDGFNESSRQRMPAMIRNLADDILRQAFLDW